MLMFLVPAFWRMHHVASDTKLNRRCRMNEKVYKTMSSVGGWNIALGVLMIVVGVAMGILSIIHGGRLLHDKKDITF